MTRHADDRDIRQYLLGRSSEQDETALEAAYFGDPALLQRIEAIADDLADEYASGRMPQADRADFERRLLASAEGRQQVAFARALQMTKPRERVVADAEATRVLPTWLGWAAAIVVMAGSAYVAWQAWPTRHPSETEAPPVATAPSAPPTAPATPAPTPEVPSQPPPALRVATLVLTSDLARSEGQPPTLIADSDATQIDLLLPSSEVRRSETPARIDTVEGRAVWTGSVQRADVRDARARARVPATALPPGDYILSLGDSSPGTPTYFFRVRR